MNRKLLVAGAASACILGVGAASAQVSTRAESSSNSTVPATTSTSATPSLSPQPMEVLPSPSAISTASGTTVAKASEIDSENAKSVVAKSLDVIHSYGSRYTDERTPKKQTPAEIRPEKQAAEQELAQTLSGEALETGKETTDSAIEKQSGGRVAIEGGGANVLSFDPVIAQNGNWLVSGLMEAWLDSNHLDASGNTVSNHAYARYTFHATVNKYEDDYKVEDLTKVPTPEYAYK